ncbi:MAG: hypothetical protein HOL14_07485 [Phycisphaerae bacterium]|jgi:hypothetical protein|nr:hypothetical protein [Phycisphaerae bacterium]
MTNNRPQKNANKRLGLLVAGVSSLFSLLLIALLFAIGSNEPEQPERVRSDDVIDLLQSTLPTTTPNTTDSTSNVGIDLPQGGWVQQTDEFGKLSQQYRCESLDPNPPDLPSGWIEMKKPEVEFFPSDSQLIVITGDKGIANAPQRILESGEIAGHVRVEMYDLDKQGIKISTLPSMVLTTPQARFDNFLGEITCDSEVRVVSASQKLSGRQLTIRFNDKIGRIEYLRLEELDFLEFYPNNVQPNTLQPSPQNSTEAKSSSIKKKIKKTKQNTSHRIHAAAVGPTNEYYIVTFLDNVSILQGDQLTGRVAFGDKLTVAFSDESDSSSMARIQPRRTIAMLPFGIPSTIVATALASTLQGPTQPPVRLTCDGGLTMVPLLEEALRPSTPEDTRIELFASAIEPVKLIDNIQNMTATGAMLRYEVAHDRIDLFGSPSSLIMNDFETLSEHLWVAREDGEGGAVGSGQMKSIAPTSGSTSLIWNDGVDFYFGSDGEDALDKVICNGDVILSDEGSTVTCSTLTVHFQPDDEGGSSPSVAFATGQVKAMSDTQTMWSDEAQVTFIQNTKEVGEDDSMLRGTKADKMKATGDVQVLLDDGGRAFCNALEGDISQDIAILEGDVLIAYKRMLMNRGDFATLTLDRASGKGRWNGAGQALFLDAPLDVTPNHRIARPDIDNKEQQAKEPINISMRTNWKKNMLLDRTFNNDAGAIDLKGSVDVRSQRSSIERSQMTGDDLRLEFEKMHDDAENDERQLKKVIAKNDAKIEHRSWEPLDLEAPPVVYYIGGNHIEFDAITFETLAVGNGELVLRDPRVPNKELHQSSLAGRGTTRFTWDKKLITTKLSDDLYRIEMNGNVQMLHKGLDGSIGMLTSDRIEAISVDPNRVRTNKDGSSELTMRGMDLQQLVATGTVYIATESRTVDCDLFDYNLRTGIADLSATQGRTIAILTQGSPYPVRAEVVSWNMDPAIDTITIRGLQGSSPQ